MSIHERLGQARRQLTSLERDYRDLHAGTGRWRATPEGQAARDRHEGVDRLDHAQRAVQSPNTSRRNRRTATKALPALEAAATAAEQHWHSVGGPAASRLHSSIRTARATIDSLEAQALIERLDHLQHVTPSRGMDRDLGISL
jgi:hypothetical protein